VLKDVNAEKAQLNGIVESLETMLAERDGEIQTLRTEASLKTRLNLNAPSEVIVSYHSV